MPMSCLIISPEFKTSRKHLLLFYWLCQSLWLCRSLQTGKLFKKMRIPDHHICLLRYAGQEATVRNRYGTTDWFQIGKGVNQGSISCPCLFNLYAEYIMLNPGLDEAEAGIKITWKNISNFRYADGTTLMEEVKRNWGASWGNWKRRVKNLA